MPLPSLNDIVRTSQHPVDAMPVIDPTTAPARPDPRRRARWTIPAVLVLIWVAAFAFAAYGASIPTTWSVPPDEFQFQRIAINMALNRHPLPTYHETLVVVPQVVFPLLISPAFAFVDVPTGFRLAHIVGAASMASAVFPAYLLAVRVTRSRWTALLIGALTVSVPWMAMTMALMTEVAAYPVFLWLVYAIVRAADSPSRSNDLLLLGVAALAFFTRPQFLLGLAGIPLALLFAEIATARRRRPENGLVATTLLAVRGVVSRHLVLSATPVVLALLVIGLWLVTGSPLSFLGGYSAIADGEMLPDGTYFNSTAMLAVLIAGTAIAPFVVTLAWVLGSILRIGSLPPSEAAFLGFCAVVGPLMLVQAGAFNVRFASSIVQERYVMYLVPLMFIGMACGFRREASRPWLVYPVAGLLTAYFLHRYAFDMVRLPFFVSPGNIPHQEIAELTPRVAARLGFALLRPPELLGLVAIGGSVLLAFLVPRLRPARLLAFVGICILALMTIETAFVMTHAVAPQAPLHRGQDWIDDALPDGAQAAMVPGPIPHEQDVENFGMSRVTWWDTEFWNRSATTLWSMRGRNAYLPWEEPAPPTLDLDTATGRLDTPGDQPYVVMPQAERLVLPAGEVVATNGTLQVVRLRRPATAVWAVTGTDGAGRVVRGATPLLHVYDAAFSDAASATVTVSVATPQPTDRPFRTRLEAGQSQSAWHRVAPQAQALVKLVVCRGSKPVRIRLDRPAHAAIVGVVTTPGGGSCRDATAASMS